jgi:hypothetical protein
MFALKEKLKQLKSSLKVWNMDVFGNVDDEIQKCSYLIAKLDRKANTTSLSQQEVLAR